MFYPRLKAFEQKHPSITAFPPLRAHQWNVHRGHSAILSARSPSQTIRSRHNPTVGSWGRQKSLRSSKLTPTLGPGQWCFLNRKFIKLRETNNREQNITSITRTASNNEKEVQLTSRLRSRGSTPYRMANSPIAFQRSLFYMYAPGTTKLKPSFWEQS